VGVLGVVDIIVCGHTDCGVMKGVVNPEPLEPLTSVTAWLSYAQPARQAVLKEKAQHQKTQGELEFLLALTERNVVEQLDNLRTHPSVIARLEQGDLRLHGWVYDLGEGVVTAYDPEKAAFVRLESPKPKLRAARRP
jgi:carbonic anhydrase